jgi:hypothetical protein
MVNGTYMPAVTMPNFDEPEENLHASAAIQQHAGMLVN